jgi:Na+-translocating ferredoxin:NAD+ oxidoreductase RNF subunit RnfB
MVKNGDFNLKTRVEPRDILQLGTNITETIARMRELEDLLVSLPGIDCGSCGAPTCRAFAEDVVLGQAVVTDCTFQLRERLEQLAREMSDLSGQLPHTLKSNERKVKNGTQEDR